MVDFDRRLRKLEESKAADSAFEAEWEASCKEFQKAIRNWSSEFQKRTERNEESQTPLPSRWTGENDPEFMAWFEAQRLAATETFKRQHGMDFKQFWLMHRYGKANG